MKNYELFGLGITKKSTTFAVSLFSFHQVTERFFNTMISRRLLRIKILQGFYAYLKSGSHNIGQAEKELFYSIDKSYDLYHFLLLLILDVVHYAENRIGLAKNKNIPSFEDLNPNTKLIDNQLIDQLSVNTQLNSYLANKKLSWVNYPEMIKQLYHLITESDIYKQYMSEPGKDYKSDKKFVISVYSDIIPMFTGLEQNLEEQSIFWNDELDHIILMIIKTLKKFEKSQGENAVLMPLYKDIEDKDFTKKLFRKAILSKEKNTELIERFTKNWEVERIAFFDILLLQVAITEIVEFTSIPTRVSLNEYIEISKYYSTSKSSVFINGVLDKIIQHLKENDEFKKSGRGLLGEKNEN